MYKSHFILPCCLHLIVKLWILKTFHNRFCLSLKIFQLCDDFCSLLNELYSEKYNIIWYFFWKRVIQDRQMNFKSLKTQRNCQLTNKFLEFQFKSINSFSFCPFLQVCCNHLSIYSTRACKSKLFHKINSNYLMHCAPQISIKNHLTSPP